MDTVPYAFRTAVIATLGKPFIIGENFSSKLWRRAAEKETQHRVDCELKLHYQNGLWDYSIRMLQNHIFVGLSFEEFKNLNRRHVRFTIVKIGSPCAASIHSSFEEIKVIVRYTRPCVNMSRLSLTSTRNYPQTDLLELLSMYEDSYFYEIDTHGTAHRTLDFLLPHLKSKLLASLCVNERVCSAKLKTKFKEVALNERYKFFRVLTKTTFDLDFFESLIQKPAPHGDYCILHSSNVELSHFKNMRKELQIVDHGEDFKRWRRADRIEVSVSKFGNRLHFMFFK